MAIEIIGTGKAVPPKRVSNDDLAGRVDTSDEWIRSHTGIGNRHFADDDTATSDIAEMIHEMRIKEFQLGLLSETEMREYDELCLVPEITNDNTAHETVNIEHADFVTA